MKKNNKKGFTLVEVIVVLLIVGILLAITIPSIMGYVGKAQDARYEAEGRSGYVAAQTITARLAAAGKTGTDISSKITAEDIKKELGESTGTIYLAGCSVPTGATGLQTCAFVPASNKKKAIIFVADPKDGKDATVVETNAAEYAKDGTVIAKIDGTEGNNVTITLK